MVPYYVLEEYKGEVDTERCSMLMRVMEGCLVKLKMKPVISYGPWEEGEPVEVWVFVTLCRGASNVGIISYANPDETIKKFKYMRYNDQVIFGDKHVFNMDWLGRIMVDL